MSILVPVEAMSQPVQIGGNGSAALLWRIRLRGGSHARRDVLHLTLLQAIASIRRPGAVMRLAWRGRCLSAARAATPLVADRQAA